MAKALIGYLDRDPSRPSKLTVENARLRRRVAELETLVVRLQDEGDRLAAELSAVHAEVLDAALVELQPV